MPRREKPNPVVTQGEFTFSAAFLKHGHIYGMTNGLLEAGATLRYVYDDDPVLIDRFLKTFPQAIPAESYEQVLEDADTRLIASAGCHLTKSGNRVCGHAPRQGLLYR